MKHCKKCKWRDVWTNGLCRHCTQITIRNNRIIDTLFIIVAIVIIIVMIFFL